MRAPWLADVLRQAGLPVVEHGAWKSRGREMTAIKGVVWHDTVTTTAWPDVAVANLLRDGRPDLSGPLSQMGLDRKGRFWLIAAGRANHNGYGKWGNDALGIETFCAGGLKGREEPWNAKQREAAAIGTAAILTRLGLPASMCQGHKEQDPNRKIDPYKVDMAAARRQITTLMEDDMPLNDADKKWLTDMVKREVLRSPWPDGSTLAQKVNATDKRAERLVDMVDKLAAGDVTGAQQIAKAVRDELRKDPLR